jgi:hypothetical protein
MEQFKTSIEFNDDELKVLNDVLRSTKVTFSSEEALMIKLGKASNPVLDLTFKVAVIFEQRAADIQQEAKAKAEAAAPAASLTEN